MYRRILVAIEHSAADRTIVDHVSRLAELTGEPKEKYYALRGWKV